jgi:thiol-disulfide isomerase/thioredoxin
MRRKRILLPVTLMLACLPLVESPAFAQKPKVGESAPEIELEKVVSPPSAPVPTLAGLKGKVVVLEFWGVWCGHCVENIPHLNKLAEDFGPRGVEFVSISDERPEGLRADLNSGFRVNP